ncbi:MAG: lipid-A-disaccharide synthase [Holosporaceae bacterium]|jgi:lipid-A-disaccharide synthase|nr:lipid-A-disaccharide synthase [Holosporaceae bacterium]
MKKIFIIAGEASGDYLGGMLMNDVHRLSNEEIEFSGIGGQYMEKAGLNELFSIGQLAIIGIFELVGKIFHVKKLIDRTVAKIQEYKPDLVISIDSSGFTHRVDKKIKKLMPGTPIVHYVAPPVWAWRKWRAKSLPKFLDKLLVLLPFEAELFLKHGLETVFVGHPIATDPDFHRPPEKEIQKFKGQDKIVVLLPGSRPSEINMHLPILAKVAEKMQHHYENVRFVIPTPESMLDRVCATTDNWDCRTLPVSDKSQKILAYYAADLAIAVSGSVTLELARTGTPFVTIYKTSAITHMLVKLLIQIKYVCLVNILAARSIVPELLQQDCTAENIFNHVIALEAGPKADIQKKAFEEIIKSITVDDPNAAAREILKIFDLGRK